MNILDELILQKEKNIEYFQHSLIAEAYSILKGEKISKNIFLNQSANSNAKIFIQSKLDSDKIFSEKDIKNCCINFSLRFLNSKIYKSELPYEAHIKKSAFEIETGQNLNFLILTEASNFSCAYPNTQQLIFADIGNGEYYFIYQWGRKYSSYRKIASLPYKNIEYLFLYILFLSGISTLVTPTTFITTKPNIDYFSMIRMAYFFWCIVFISAIFSYYIIGIRKGLNNSLWDNSSFL